MRFFVSLALVCGLLLPLSSAQGQSPSGQAQEKPVKTEWTICEVTRRSVHAWATSYMPAFEYSTERAAAAGDTFRRMYGEDVAGGRAGWTCGGYTFPTEAHANAIIAGHVRQAHRMGGPTTAVPLPFDASFSAAERAGYIANWKSGSYYRTGIAPPPSKYMIEIEAEVRRLGPHRRAEAQRLVDMRMAAEAARGKAVAPAVAPAQMVKAPPPASSRYPAYVASPRLPDTKPPAGFHDSNRFTKVSDPKDAKAMFTRFSGDCGGKIEYLTSGCYPDGNGQYSCQARVRCPSSTSPAKVIGQ